MTDKQPVILIHKRYRIEGVIGRGTFGIVCLGTDTHNNSMVAIKLEPISHNFLTHESSILSSLAGTGIPRIHYCGREGAFTAMVMDMLGPSLQDLFNHCGRRFSLKTTLMLADQLLARLQHLQSHGVVHRDLKPHNVLMGFGDQGHTVHLVDFGMATSSERSTSLERCGFYGTARYASLAAHLSYEQTQRDDVESLAYTLIYFLRGFLPWTGLRAGRQRQDLDVVGRKKLELSPEDIAKGLPVEFARHVRYARSLSHGETVDYPALRLMYRCLYEREGFVDDSVFDWTHSQPRRLHDHLSDVGSDVDAST